MLFIKLGARVYATRNDRPHGREKKKHGKQNPCDGWTRRPLVGCCRRRRFILLFSPFFFFFNSPFIRCKNGALSEITCVLWCSSVFATAISLFSNKKAKRQRTMQTAAEAESEHKLCHIQQTCSTKESNRTYRHILNMLN